jgi:Tol biopolymer transport system component/putative intracellular protease/amidase
MLALILASAFQSPAVAQTHYESIGWTSGGEALTVSADGDVYTLPLDSGPATRLTTAEARDVHASWAPDGSAVAFGSYRDGDAEIFVTAPDGSDARPLTDDEADDGAPSWSPDGRSIAFMKKDGDRWRLWIMSSDGSDARRLTRSAGNDFNPRWSPDGRWIVFESSRHEGDQDEIYVIRPDGSGERRLTDTPGNDIYPDWSPDGKRIAYCTIEGGRAFIHVIPASGGEPELLVEDACLPAWAPGGSRLAFTSIVRGQPERLWVADPDGSGATEVAGLGARPVVDAANADDDEADESAGAAEGPRKPRVAILVYDGVQIIDHAAPWEVFGQYSLNEVFTVAKDTTPITTYMGMRVLPSYGFSDHPEPDVVVIPGGDAGDARADPEVIDWIRRNGMSGQYVLGICSGVTLLAEADLLKGRRVTTFYNLLDDLAERRPDITVVDDELVVEDGKYVTTTGTGIEGALRVVELLHGEPWARVVMLNIELQPLPEIDRTPRARLADMNLPSSIYGKFPWREAELAAYDGDTTGWTMTWRFDGDDVTGLADSLSEGLRGEDWTVERESLAADEWTSHWSLDGRDGGAWQGTVRLTRRSDGRLELRIQVASG